MIDFSCGNGVSCLRQTKVCLEHEMEHYHLLLRQLKNPAMTLVERLSRERHLKEWRHRIYTRLFQPPDSDEDSSSEDSGSYSY
jgi:hypothetical protein